ncbi:MAG: 50S ribosomal protein L23 [Francisellaceae bacterium]
MSQERLLKVLLAPHVSEKAATVADVSGHVVFKVVKTATKLEVKKAVEMMFGVSVESVKTVNVKGKARRFGRIEGRTKDWKKAYVKLAEGHDINFIGAE